MDMEIRVTNIDENGMPNTISIDKATPVSINNNISKK